MKNIRWFKLGLSFLAIAVMVSCLKEEIVAIAPDSVESETIAFNAVVDWGEYADVDTKGAPASNGNRVGNITLSSNDSSATLPVGIYVKDGIHTNETGPATKGSKITSSNINSFIVWATLKGTDQTTLFFPVEGELFEPDDNAVYHSDPAYFWPGAGTLDFVAVANAPANGFTANINEAGTQLESFSYTVPTDATQQNDIVVATESAVSGALNQSQPLDFRHIMSAVNVKVGSYMAEGTIKSITLKGVYNSGSYNPTTNRWTINTESTSDYSVKFANGNEFTTEGHSSGDLINADNATFMFIPQQPGAAAEMVVIFNDGNKDYEAKGSIAGDNWDMNKTTNYMLSVDESYNITIETDPQSKKLDAHYIIAKINVTVKGISKWSVSAKASDGDVVTIQPERETNPLAQQGFWTDKKLDANGNETASARGADSWPDGSGDTTNEIFYVFIPENISNKDREITITLKSDENQNISSSKVLVQKHPNWTGDIGWEVVDDEEAGKYGFIWDRKVAYVLKYSWNRSTGLGGNYSKTEGMDYLNSLITTYSASNYVSAVEFNYKDRWSEGFANPPFNENRAYLYIDYSKLNNLSGASSPTEGFNNTKALFNIGGSAASMVFETVVSTTLKTKGDTSDPTAFHKVISTDQYHTKYSVPAEEGRLNDLSGILTYILKKNRYCMQYVDDGQTQTYHAVFNENDLKWFLPAYNQFPDPTVIDFTPENTTDKAADYWSSTAADGSEYAYQGGSSTPISRNTELAVIAARVNENNYAPASATVDNTSLTGGENGDTNQWL